MIKQLMLQQVNYLRKLPWVLERTDADIEKMCNSLKAFLCPPIDFQILKVKISENGIMNKGIFTSLVH